LTLLVSVLPLVHFAYRNLSLHVATETAAALIALVAAQLVHGRFRRTAELRYLALSAALATLAVANLGFSAIPAIAEADGGPFATWAPAGGRLLGSALFTAAAFLPPRPLPRPTRSTRRMIGACALALAAIAVAVALAGDALPAAIEPGLSPESSGRPRVVGNPAVLVLQLGLVLLHAAATVGFARRADREKDDLAHWLAIGATLGTFARLNYFLFPSLYSPWFYVGDILRLAFYLVLLVGGARELRRMQRKLADLAVLEERERISRELHDGVAQDLAFIVQQSRHVSRSAEPLLGLQRILTAAQRALDESRHAIAALSHPVDKPLAEALAAIARDAGGREGCSVALDLAPDVAVSPATHEALLRVAREAIINAARHAGAATIRVELNDEPQVRLCVTDDGKGFDVAATLQAGAYHGLAGMAQRVRAIDGEFSIDSGPGKGTRLTVLVP
jgi:signal transduction histidine kinase